MIRVRVVCGLSEVMATLVPTMRFTSVDLPTLGRPTKVTNPDRTSSALDARGRRRVERVQAVDTHASDPPTHHALRAQLPARHLHRLTLGGDVPELGEEQPADRVPVAFGKLRAEQ